MNPENVAILRSKRSSYAIVVPFLNEGSRIRSQLTKMRELNEHYDCILVDGGSTDEAVDEQILRECGVSTLIKTSRGLSLQLRRGLQFAMAEGYEGVVVIDGNDKDDPAAIPSFVEALQRGYDHVQGSRFVAGGKAINTPPVRYVAIRLVHAPLMSFAAGYHYTDTTNGFRGYSRRFLLDERVQPFREVFVKYELHYYLAIEAARLGFRIIELPVTRKYPAGVKAPTKISFVRGNLLVFTTLLRAVSGYYRPKG